MQFHEGFFRGSFMFYPFFLELYLFLKSPGKTRHRLRPIQQPAMKPSNLDGFFFPLINLKI